MRRIQSTFVLLLAALAMAAAAVTAGPADITLQPGSKLSLKGSSTAHDYTCQATKLEVTVKSDAARWPAKASGTNALEAFVRDGGITGIDVVVPVAGLHSAKSGLDKNMYKALKAEAHPEIRFHMAGYQVSKDAPAGEARVDAKGSLKIAGVEREVPIAVTVVRDGDAVRLRGSVPLLMSNFGIKPPTMMMGTLKTKDQVVVSFDLLIGTAIPAVSSAQ